MVELAAVFPEGHERLKIAVAGVVLDVVAAARSMRTKPMRSRSSSPVCTIERLMCICSDSSRSDGSRSPTRSSPEKIMPMT